MAHQLISRRVLATGTAGAVALCVAAVGAVPASATPEPAGHGRGAAGPERSVAAALRLMSTQEKVGQLFIQNVYGKDADDARTAATCRSTASRAPAEVVQKYHLGGVIYFAWADSVAEPRPDRRPVQRPAAGRDSAAGKARHPAADRHRPGAGRRDPGRAAGHPVPRRDGARRRPQRRPTPARRRDHRPRAAGDGHQHRTSPRTPTSTSTRSTRSSASGPSRSDPTLVAAARGGAGRRLPEDAGVAPRAKHFPGHGDTATDSHVGFPVITHTREQWERSTPRRSGPRSTRGIDTIMTAHLVVPGARRLRATRRR